MKIMRHQLFAIPIYPWKPSYVSHNIKAITYIHDFVYIHCIDEMNTKSSDIYINLTYLLKEQNQGLYHL